MASDSWRDMAGIIKPATAPASLVEMIRMLPDGIGVIPLFNNMRHDRTEESGPRPSRFLPAGRPLPRAHREVLRAGGGF